MKKDGDTNGSCDHEISQAERKGREVEKVIRVVDEESTKRAIESLNIGIAIPDLASSKDVKG